MTRDVGSSRSWTRWLGHPVGVLTAVLLVSLICGLFVYRQAWVVSVSAAVLLLMGLVLPTLMLWGVRGEVRFSRPRCRAGEAVEVEVTLANRAWYPVTGLDVEGVPGELGAVESVGPRRAATASSRWVPMRRGAYPATLPKVVCGFPLGLLERSKPLAVAERGGVAGLLVHPAEVPVEMPSLDASSRPGDALLAGRRAGSSGELTGLRPYRRGDAVREIHWRQTARHGRLIVRERQSPASPRVLVVLDTDPSSYAHDGHREHAISAAASLLRRLVEANFYPVLVLGSGAARQVELSPARSGHRDERLLGPLDALARLGPSGEPLSEVLLGVRAMAGGDAVLVVTSPTTASALRSAVRPGTVWYEVTETLSGRLDRTAAGGADSAGVPVGGVAG
ncbi:MAG: DUF58 domain-containing protein [Tepidisphaerales bacterium]